MPSCVRSEPMSFPYSHRYPKASHGAAQAPRSMGLGCLCGLERHTLTLYKAPKVYFPFRETQKGPQQPNPAGEDCLEATCFVGEVGNASLWEEARFRVTTYCTEVQAVHCTVPGVPVTETTK